MGMMLDGEWRPDLATPADDDETERFERTPSTFRDWISRDGPHPPEAGRYHLYISRACPWAHRTVIVRRLLGLEESISLDIVDPIRVDDGWEFSPEKPGCTEDSLHAEPYLRGIYRRANPDYTGRVTVPVLWDREEETIVNNESSEIIQMLDREFGEFAKHDVTLYPDGFPVEERIEDLYESINNGVYEAGFSRSQKAYEEAVEKLFDALANWNEVLSDQRYLCGDRLTAADICLFTTLYRFDEIYHTHFKCNRRRIIDYEHVWGHTREIFQLPGVAVTCNMDHCKSHYYRSHRNINPSGIVPVGPSPDFTTPHDRNRLPGTPPGALVEAD